MSDLDIINSLTNEPERPINHVTLEEIINSVPCMTLNNPATYALYLHYNKAHLLQDEVDKINIVIEKFRVERTNINKRNLEYMEKHKKEDTIKKLIEETE